MRATKANLKRCSAGAVMYCRNCHTQSSADDGDYFNHPDDHVFDCDFCGTEMVLGHFYTLFTPASPRVICVIHDQGDWISTWTVDAEPDADPLEAIYKELFEGDEDWDSLKEDIEWFYLDRTVAETLRDIEWPETYRDDQTFEHNTVKATVYRAFKVDFRGELSESE